MSSVLGNSLQNSYDVVVVGAGHAGVEACLSSARRGLKTLMVTTNLDRIAFMSCNPSIGGLAKGHMVREIDALGGEMGRAADLTCIQFKRLNSRKGPAVRGSRTQNDKDLYSSYMAGVLKSQADLDLLASEVKALILDQDECRGVTLADGSNIFSKTVIITTGTFMNAVMHVGDKREAGGRVGDQASIGLSDQLAAYGFEVKRLKTGTPPRLLDKSIDWSKTEEQTGDEKFFPFSFRSERKFVLPQVSCFLTKTNEKTHEVIRENLKKSPLYAGIITGAGPRYCPSVEDKVVRFEEKLSHQSFLEPEGLSSNSIYLQGISTSLPEEVQDQFLRTIPGLEKVEVLRYGYAVEYDYIQPTQIWPSLETRGIRNLFLAGQINGTSGYEEAAGQGLVAGINAGNRVLGLEPLILRRDQAYIGVLIDDLVTKGTKEPYRMFTSRAEYRLVLREDNALDRLGDLGIQLGLLKGDDLGILSTLSSRKASLLNSLRSQKLVPNEETQDKLRKLGTAVLQKSHTFEEILRRPELNCLDLPKLGFELSDEDPAVLEPVEIEVKYSGYVAREEELIRQARKKEETKIPDHFDYSKVRGLSSEEREKLDAVRPLTLGQAQRISGVNPPAIQAIMIYLKARTQEGVRKNG